MDRYSEDELRILKQMSEEVFVISNKPQLPIVQKMKQTPCDIMSTGFKKYAGDFFYCKQCDKEHKFPICKKCFDKCHKGHLKSDNIKQTDIIPSMCMCGYKCHSMLNKKKEEDIDIEQNTSKCYFNNLSLAAGQYEYFIAINGRKICSFCYHFCCHNLTTSEDDEESKMKAFQKYQFRKMRVSREVFIKGLEEGLITCDCLSLIDSKHRFSDNLYIYLNDLNIPYYSEDEDDNYFGNSSPTKIINLFFNSVELFETIYTNFILEYNEFMEGLSNKNDLLSINAALNLGYANFSNNANNCSYNLYINEKINVYFTVTLTKCLLEKNLKINEQNNIFLINYLRGFIKFRLGSYIEQIPKYLITDIFNLNPFQRRIWREKCCSIFFSSGLKKENLIKTILSSIERIIRQKPDLGESIQIFIELFRIIKFYSRFFFLNKEEITEICKVLEEFFSYLTEFYSTEDTIEILYKDERAKLFKTIIKIITYFSVYINDETFFSFYGLKHPLEEEEDPEKAFFHCFTEASKLTNKILILLCHGIRQEYDIVTYLINKNKQKMNEKTIVLKQNQPGMKKPGNEQADEVFQDKASNDKEEDDLSPMTNEEYQIILMRTLHIVQINLDFSLQNQDVYMQGLLRLINKNLPLFFNLINDNYSENEQEQLEYMNFAKLILEFTDNLEDLYYNFYNTSHITIDFIQDYIISVTNNILSKFNGNLENLLFKQGSIYYCEYSNIFKDDVVNKNSKITYEFLINKSSNFLYSLTKVFKLSKDKSVFSEELCRNIIKICFAFINDNPDNAIIALSTPILINLSKIPRPYLCCVLDYMTLCLKVLQKYNANITFGFFMAKFGFLIHHKTTENSKANRGKSLPNTYLCLVKLFNLLDLIFTFDIYDQNQYLDFIRPNLQIFIEDELIFTYKLYLLRIAEDFAKYRKYYTSKRIFDQPELFDRYFKKFITVSNNFNSSLIFQIFFMFLKLTNKAFDVNALEKTPDFLSDFFSQRDILTILSIITLDIPLRVELIKYFRMIYIDLSIEIPKMEEYRYQFHQEIDVEVERIDTLMNIKSMKVFLFLQRLLKVSNYSFNSELSQLEYQLIFFEAKNFKKIVMNAKHCDKKVYMSYLENGLILPIKVYLNKISSMMMTIRGEGLLQLYRFCYYVLKMKEFIIESNIILNIPEEDKLESVFKDQDFVGEGGLADVKKDIEYITNPNFSVLNYREIYVLINKHVMSLIEEPTSSELVLYLSEYKKFEEKEKEVLKNQLRKNGIDLEKPLYKNAWEAYECYMEQKNNFDKSSLKANFDDTLINGEVTLRTIALKYLLFLAKNKANIFEEEGVNMLLKLLKNEPDESQASIFLKNDKDENKNINIKRMKGKENNPNQKTFEGENPVITKRESQVEDINYMAKSCFENILSSIFNQYNPTSLKLSNQYYHACHIIKVFKYLCEANNQYFQKRLMNDITFSISSSSKLNFYDMMLFVIDKIIVISSWEQAKGEDIVQDYFYGLFSCIIELIIEIIRGTDSSIFRNFFNNEDFEDNSGANNANNINSGETLLNINNNNNINNSGINSNNNIINLNNNASRSQEKKMQTRRVLRRKTRKMTIQRYQRGKALKIFLNNIKSIMFESTSENEIIFSVRKSLMDFLLSFMEEVNCPRKIKHLIMSFYHPNIIIKSICSTLKLYYLKKFKMKESNAPEVKQVRTNQIIEQNLSQGNLGNKSQCEKKPLYKLLKQLKFNEDLCNKFLDLYFEDTEFSETKTFELCSVYFRYFILTYIQYKNEETIDYWNRIHGQTQETLYEYNNRSKINNNLDAKYGTVNDESDFEAYYVIKLFKEIVKFILVKAKPDIPPIYVVYTVHPYSRYLSSDSKDEFLRNVDRTNRYSKLYDLITSSEYFRLEIIYNWNYLRKSQILRKSTEINYHMLGYATFFIALILNFVLFCTLHHGGEESYGYHTQQIVDIFSYIMIVLEFIIIIFWFMTKYLLYLEIEMAKYKEKHYQNNKFDDTQLTYKDKFKIRWRAIFGKGELTPFLLYLLFTIPGIIDGLRFFYSFSLLSILSLSRTLNNIAKSLIVKGNSLAWTSLFTLVLLYVFAGWGFYFQRDRFYETSGRDKPDEMCKSLLYCFLTMVNNGMRWHCGVGKITRSESYILHFWPFVHRFAFDLSFFWLIEAIMLKIVYGIILDSFGELRQAHYLIEKDTANNCFICNVEKDACEKNNISFEEHCNQVHNVWDYAFYMITLRMKEASTLNSSNARNRKKIIEKSVDWLPDATLDKLEDTQKKKENDGVDLISKIKDMVTNNNNANNINNNKAN